MSAYVFVRVCVRLYIHNYVITLKTPAYKDIHIFIRESACMCV